jgi:hypothetical protein
LNSIGLIDLAHEFVELSKLSLLFQEFRSVVFENENHEEDLDHSNDDWEAEHKTPVFLNLP